MLQTLTNHFGKDREEILRTLLSEQNLQSSDGMPVHIYRKIMDRIAELTTDGNAGS